MKIAEDTEDRDIKDTAKVNFGMANASMKWNDHMSDILKGIEGIERQNNQEEDREEVAERSDEDEDPTCTKPPATRNVKPRTAPAPPPSVDGIDPVRKVLTAIRLPQYADKFEEVGYDDLRHLSSLHE